MLAKVLNAGLGGFAQDDLEALVAGLGGRALLAAADDFAVGGHVVEAVLTGVEERLKTLGLAVGFDALDAVFAARFAGVAFAGLEYLWPLVHRLAVRVDGEATPLQGDLGPAVLKIRRRIVELKHRGALPGQVPFGDVGVARV